MGGVGKQNIHMWGPKFTSKWYLYRGSQAMAKGTSLT